LPAPSTSWPEPRRDNTESRTQRLALLDEAMTQLGGLTIEAQQLRDSRELIKWVTDARRDARGGGVT